MNKTYSSEMQHIDHIYDILKLKTKGNTVKLLVETFSAKQIDR